MDDQTIEVVGYVYLAAEAAGFFGLKRKIQHVFFHAFGGAHFFKPCIININLACGTGAGTTAFSQNARNQIIDSAVLDGLAVGTSTSFFVPSVWTKVIFAMFYSC